MTAALAAESLVDVVWDGSLLLAIPIALAAGLVSFLSPCVLPLAPGYLAYVTGLTGADIAAKPRVRSGSRQPVMAGGPGGSPGAESPEPSPAAGSTGQLRGRVVLGACLFVLGFTVVFVSYGLLFGELGGWLLVHQRTITIVLGVVVIALGLGFLGVGAIARTMWWNAERRARYRPPTGLWGAPLLGVVFALGWTPCIGPTLAAVQSLAFTQASAARGAILSLAYCVGLGVPFVLIALGLRWAAGALNWTRVHHDLISRSGGAMLVIVGVLLVTGWWSDLVTWLQTLAPGFTVAI
jgi:cytochrome c-type biogenesis protein